MSLSRSRSWNIGLCETRCFHWNIDFNLIELDGESPLRLSDGPPKWLFGASDGPIVGVVNLRRVLPQGRIHEANDTKQQSRSLIEVQPDRRLIGNGQADHGSETRR